MLDEKIIEQAPKAGLRSSIEEVARVDPVTWAMYFRRLRGHSFKFDVRDEMTAEAMANERTRKMLLLRQRPFLIGPLSDTHPHKAYEKGRQVGVSELALTEEMWFLWANPDKKFVHTFPRDKQLQDFSTTRIAPALRETPRMRSIVGVPNQVYVKKIGYGFLMLRSAWESNLGEGIDADGVVFDEKDRMQAGIDVAFRESLKSSNFGWIREVSTPTLPGKGVDEPYSVSDQREWHVRCKACSMWQTVDYPDNVIQMSDLPLGSVEIPDGAFEFRCRKPRCRGELDRLTGQWVARYPDRKNIRGYWIPQTIAPWISATQLMRNKAYYKFQQLFENYCLGRPSVSDNILLSESDFEYSIAGHGPFTSRTPEWERITVGIDWGHLNWVTVIGTNSFNHRKYLLAIEVFDDDAADANVAVAVGQFLAPFDPDVIVPDSGYGKDRNKILMKKFPGKVFSCFYNSSDKSSRTIKPVWSEDKGQVLCDRTISLKETCLMFKERELGLPAWDQKVKLLQRHFLNLTPMKEEDEDDGTIVEVIRAKGDDHLAHAVNYARLGMEKLEGGTSPFSFEFVG